MATAAKKPASTTATDTNKAKATAKPKESAAKVAAKPKEPVAKSAAKQKEPVAKATAKPKESAAKVAAKPKESVTKAAAKQKEPVAKAAATPKEPVAKAAATPKEPVAKAAATPKEPVAKAAATPKEPVAKAAATPKEPVAKAAAKTKEPVAKAAAKTKEPVAKAASTPKEPVASAPSKTATKTVVKEVEPKAVVVADGIVSGKISSDADLLAMPEADYMNPAQMAYFKSKLVTMRDDILDNARETGEHLKENEVFADPNDRATVEEENMLEQRVRDRERKLLKKITSSLARIEEGTYGYCLETGDPIGLPRLLARPTAELSIEAQEKHERLEKLYAD